MDIRNNGIWYSYRDGVWHVEQFISSFSPYQLEGDLDEVKKRFAKLLREYKKYYQDQPCELQAAYALENRKPLHYPRLTVQFDELYLQLGHDYDSTTVEVWGKRKPVREELKELERQRQERDDQERQRREREYLKMKKEFEGGEK